jgi:hypothetical protein
MSNEIIFPTLFYNVPQTPSGMFNSVFTTVTTTTPIPPLPQPLVNIPDSGVRDFTIINPYIHYSHPQISPSQSIISITPSAYLEIAPRLFNLYNLVDRRDARTGTFKDANSYLTSPN